MMVFFPGCETFFQAAGLFSVFSCAKRWHVALPHWFAAGSSPLRMFFFPQAYEFEAPQ